MRKLFVCMACATVLAITSGTASAQYGRPPGASSGVSGEDYHVELAYALWRPSRTSISSESLGIIGNSIDAVTDLGFETETFQDFKVVLRASRKFKFRFGYTPIKYEGDTILTRTIVFNGQRYTIGLPVTSELDWKSWRFGAEYDFISRSRGFVGFIFEGKYTDINVPLRRRSSTEFTHVKVPIPTIGGIGRVYVARNVAMTGELTGLKLTIQDDSGKYLEVRSERAVQLQQELRRAGRLPRADGRVRGRAGLGQPGPERPVLRRRRAVLTPGQAAAGFPRSSNLQPHAQEAIVPARAIHLRRAEPGFARHA